MINCFHITNFNQIIPFSLTLALVIIIIFFFAILINMSSRALLSLHFRVYIYMKNALCLRVWGGEKLINEQKEMRWDIKAHHITIVHILTLYNFRNSHGGGGDLCASTARARWDGKMKITHCSCVGGIMQRFSMFCHV